MKPFAEYCDKETFDRLQEYLMSSITVFDFNELMSIDNFEDDFPHGWLYSRDFGFIPVATGCHVTVMATLYAKDKDPEEILGIRLEERAENWLIENEGSMMLSAISNKPLCHLRSKLTPKERNLMNDFYGAIDEGF